MKSIERMRQRSTLILLLVVLSGGMCWQDGIAASSASSFNSVRAKGSTVSEEKLSNRTRSPRAERQSKSGTPGAATQQAVVNFIELADREALTPAGPQEPRAVHPPMRLRRDLPGPSGVLAPGGEPLPGANGRAKQPLSPAPAASFLAVEDDNSSIPPDTHGAVGPNHLMVTLNTQVRIQDRMGRNISTVSLGAFWAGLGNPATFDPKVLYDPFSNRWIFVTMADGDLPTSALLIAVSQTDDPTGNWTLRRVDTDPRNRMWADFPSIGFNKDWIVVDVNMFDIGPNGGFNRSQIYAFDKTNLYAGGPGRFTMFFDSNIFITAPAVTYDNSLSTLYLLTSIGGNRQGTGVLRLLTIIGAVGAEVLTPGPFVTSPAPWDIESPNGGNFAPQRGSRKRIDVGDDRMQNLVYRNGALWATHTVFLPAGAPTHSAIQWWQITPDGNIQQRGRIEDPTGNISYAYPSIAVNRKNDVLVGYSGFSANQFASSNYSFRSAGDPPNTMQSDTRLREGEAAYFKTFGGELNRWGDYSMTMVDPVNDTDMWTIQEYAATPAGGDDRWGTWWAEIIPGGGGPPPPPGNTVMLSSGQPVMGSIPAPGLDPVLGQTQYTIEVPGGAQELRVDLTGNQDVDLFIRFGQRITVDNGRLTADYFSESASGTESITITPSSFLPLQQGTYFIAVANFGPGAATFTVTAAVTEGGPSHDNGTDETEPYDGHGQARQISTPSEVNGEVTRGISTVELFSDQDGNGMFNGGPDDLNDDFFRIDATQRTRIARTLSVLDPMAAEMGLFLFNTSLPGAIRSSADLGPPFEPFADSHTLKVEERALG